MGFWDKIKKFFTENLFSTRWRCLLCGKEIFDGGYFCAECKKSLPYNDGPVCNHCGRKVNVRQEYCSTCKGRLLSVDQCRSVFVYKSPVSNLIKKMKFDGGSYIAESFGEQLSSLYLKNYLNADCVVFVPMTKKLERKRGYNQSKLLALEFSKRTGLPIADCIEKKIQTDRQATLNRAERLKNLKGVFKVTSRKAVKGKKVVIIDDVTTTGATAEALSSKLKQAGAINVYLLTVASVPAKDGY